MTKRNTVRPTAAIVLAAGLGTRMKSGAPKVMHPLAGRPMIQHLMATIDAMGIERTVVVVGEGMADVSKAVAPHPVAIQKDRLGTAHAVLAAKDAIAGFRGDVLVLFGDAALVTADTLRRMLKARRDARNPAVVVLGFRPDDPSPYGRLVLDSAGNLDAIVETADAGPKILKQNLCNSGVMAIDGTVLLALLDRVDNKNAKREYYLTDIVALARAAGRTAAAVEGSTEELLGINSRAELAAAEAIVQQRLRAAAMANGATLIDPATVTFSFDTRIGRDVTVGPNVVFGPGVVVGNNVEIRAFCHIEGAAIRSGAIVGPFARLRPGAHIGEGAHIGNFVEIKNARIESGAKVNHLSYVGDARVGARANIGAGTITCNYDGAAKHRTDIGSEAFIGSNTALVAPVTVGDGAVVGAGSVITRDVAPGALAISRPPQKEIPGWAKRARGRKKAPGDCGGIPRKRPPRVRD